jgi:metallo-beta-lactamase class B
MSLSLQKKQDNSTKMVIAEDLKLVRLKKHIWIHISYTDLEGFGRVPANGLLIDQADEAILIDTPWNNRQTQMLFDWVKNNLNAAITQVVVCHSHDDCIGGLEAAHNNQAVSYCLNKTQQIAKKAGKEIPLKTFTDMLSIRCGKLGLILKYLGPGHTIDNIVVWVPEEKLLFAGCLVRSTAYQTLGFTQEADLNSWPQTLKKIPKKFPTAEIVVPGHGPHGGLELISHTIKLCENFNKKEKTR